MGRKPFYSEPFMTTVLPWKKCSMQFDVSSASEECMGLTWISKGKDMVAS